MSKKRNNKKGSPTASSASANNPVTNKASKKPFILFVLALSVIMVVYFWVYNQDFFDVINLPIVKGYAWIGSKILNIFGQATFSEGSYIASDLFSMDISKGCDAITPTILFMAAVITFPILFKLKIPALLIAPPALAILNIIRIVSLFLIGAYLPNMFEFAHIELWQVIFILICFIGWVYWLLWANKKKKTT